MFNETEREKGKNIGIKDWKKMNVERKFEKSWDNGSGTKLGLWQ
jgi:hypothetical protein